ncbi:MAG: radical SAM protein [Gammaproteobacteria bacterium]|nr:radical SAM protein [Gammaproteobacteria bacterium]
MTAAAHEPWPAPALISWNLTRRCNLECGHCYLDATRRGRPAADELDTGAALALLDDLSAGAAGAMLVLTGGEPLLRRDLAEIVRAAAGHGLMPVIGSNGTLLDPRRARELRAAGAAGVGISLDSATPAFHDRLRGRSGAWADARAGLGAAQEAGLPILVQTTLFTDNLTDLEPLAGLAEALGAMAFNVFFLVCTGRGVQQTDLSAPAYEAALTRVIRLQEERPGIRIRARCAPYARRLLGLHAGCDTGPYAAWSSACLAGRSYGRITPAGRLTPCPYLPEPVADLRTQSFSEVWQTDPLLRRLRFELPGGKCGVCDFRYSCGGCRARAYAAGGDALAQDPKCRYEPAPGSLPELRPTQATGPEWTPEAEARLARIPAFVRGHVRRRLEQIARNDGVDRITAAFMHARRPRLGGLARPHRPATTAIDPIPPAAPPR